jgi:hypothetical protein
MILYDFGLVYPTFYPSLTSFNDPTVGVSNVQKNNIFLNNTLFQAYSTIFRQQIDSQSAAKLTFKPLDPQNSWFPRKVAFYQSYSCSELVQKPALSIVQAVLIGDYVFLHTSYAMLALLLAWWYKRRENGTTTFGSEVDV